MVHRWERGYTTTVELSDDQFWRLYFQLDSLTKEFQKASDASGFHISPFRLIVDGKEYYRDEINEAFGKLQTYISESGVTSSEYETEQARQKKMFEGDDLSLCFEPLPENPRNHTPSMEFKVWEYVLALMGAFEEPESNDSGPDDYWSPPENFQNGTDDEREVWEASQATKKM